MSFYEALIAPFVEFGFMRRALVGCLALSLSASPIGAFLIMRRMSLSGDAMAHAILPGVAVGYLLAGLSLPVMALGGLAAGILVVLASSLVARATAQMEDASLASFHLLALAAGVALISLSGSNIDLVHVLFGSILALDDDALTLVCLSASVTLFALALIFRPLLVECADPTFLASVSRWSAPAHFGFMLLLVLNLVTGFQALGTLMAVGIMILPPAAARFWAVSVGRVMAIAVLIAVMASLIGLLASYHYALPSGPAIILAAGALYLGSVMLGTSGSLFANRTPRKHLEA